MALLPDACSSSSFSGVAPSPGVSSGDLSDGPAVACAAHSAPAEARLARLAALVGPLRRVMAAVAAALVDTRAYERLCYARLSDYARERPGVSLRQLQELARVHRALAELPGLEAALLANLLPWSKVRLLVGVATADDERAWIARARALPVRRLEREVKEAREARAGPAGGGGGSVDGEATESPSRQVSVRCTPAAREAWLAVRDLAECVAGRRLSAGEALEHVLAEVLSGIPVDPAFAPTFAPWLEEPPRQQADGPEREGEEEAEERALDRVPGRELPAEVVALAEGLEEAAAAELDRRLLCAVQLEQTLDAAMAPLLRVVRSGEYEWSGDRPRRLSQFAPEQLAMSASKARALIRLERAAEICPELREAWREGRLSWVKAQCLLPLLLLDIEGPWRAAWVAWAERVTMRRLEADVERALLLRGAYPRAWERCQARPERAREPIPPDERQMCAPEVELDATEELVWQVPCEVASLFRALCATLQRRLYVALERMPTPSEVLEALLELARRSWCARAPGARRPSAVLVRDHWRCAVPGCSSRAQLHEHHVVFRSAGGPDAPENLIALCAFHHHRCLHAGRLRIHGRAPDGLVFELPLGRYRSGDVALPAPSGSPAARSRPVAALAALAVLAVPAG